MTPYFGSQFPYLGYQFFVNAPAVPKTWLDYVAPEFAEKVAQWVYTRDHYTGEANAPWNVPRYLIRKKVGEAMEAYEERVLLTDYTPHFGSVVDTLAGMLAQVEPNANRTFGRGKTRPTKAGPLGSMTDPSTIMGKLALDADGDHNGWLTFWQLLATELVALHDAWVLIDGGADGTTPRLKLIGAERVRNWRYENGTLVEALLVEAVDSRSSIQDNPDQFLQEQYVRFTLTGWERWQKKKSNSEAEAEDLAVKIDEGSYNYVDRNGNPCLPIFRAQLPLRRNVGFLLARKANAIFNKESERDHLLRFACFPILNVVANDTLFKKVTEWLRNGARVLQVLPGNASHSFIAPSEAPATVLNTTIDAKVSEFYAVAFREFGTAARSGRDRVTATEIKAEVAIGISAFLGLLRSAVDNAENTALYLLEQTVFPRDPGKWGLATVQRSNDFAPFDYESMVERLRIRYFGAASTVPVGKTGRFQAAKEIAEHDGLEVNDDEMMAEIEKLESSATVTKPTFGGAGKPAPQAGSTVAPPPEPLAQPSA